MPAVLLALVLLLVSPALRGQQVTIPEGVRAAADRITADQLAQDLDYLASDALLGRNTPSPGFDTAAEYIAKRLERAGLKPLGDSGTFFQHYVMRESHVDTAAAYLEVGEVKFRFGDHFVIRSFAGPVTGALPVVYVGHGWTVPGRDIDPYAGVDVKGKIVLAHGPRALPKGVVIQQIGRITVGANTPFVEAARRGAAGIIFIPQTSAFANWAQMQGQNTVARELEPRVPSAYAAPSVTSVLLAQKATEGLLAGERVEGGELIALGDRQEYPPSFQLKKSITLHVPIASTTDHRPYNVVALMEGNDPVLKDEYITIESHLDGAVGTRTVDGDGVYNSADDNASGSSANLAIAERIMTGPRPKRSLIFIWDSGEERGLWGTRYFVHRPPVPLERIVAHVNIDMIGANRAPGSPDAEAAGATGPHEVYLIGPGVLSGQTDTLLERTNREYLNLRFNRDHDRADSEFFYPRTDAGPFLERGILTIGFTTGMHARYHAPSDEARYLDSKKMEAIARTVFVAAWMLADSTARPHIDRSIPPTVLRYR
jgi:Zn-dependent M28 family amino/carboxypeptidase